MFVLILFCFKVAKELTHRGDELRQLGWSQQDVFRYIDLWDYRQRWGAINLEREDRQFLRKAESALPEIKSSKTSIKKPLKEKSYYCRLSFFLQEMIKAESAFDLSEGAKGIWIILLEEELRSIDYFQPVLGLPDALKSKLLIPFRENLISILLKQFSDNIQMFELDFDHLLKSAKSTQSKTWKPLREGISESIKSYPILDSKCVPECRKVIRNEVIPMIRNTFPSLVDKDIVSPADDWIPDS